MNPYIGTAPQGIPTQVAQPQMAPGNQNYQQQLAQALMSPNSGASNMAGAIPSLSDMMNMQKIYNQNNPKIFGTADGAQQVGVPGGFTQTGSLT